MNKHLRLIFSLLLFVSLKLSAQTVYIEINADGQMQELNGIADVRNTDCGDCNGGPDPQLRTRFSVGGTWGSVYYVNTGGCGSWGGFGTTFTGNYTHTQSIGVQLGGREDDGGTITVCLPHDGDCYWENNPNTGSNNIAINSYCGTHYNWSGYYYSNIENCASDGSTNDYQVRWRFRYYFVSGFTAGTIDQADQTNCVGFDPAAMTSSGFTSCFASRQWQVNSGSGWSNAGATGTTYDPGAIGTPGTYQYRCEYGYYVNFSGTINYVYSNIRTYTIVADPTAPSLSGATPTSGSTVCMTDAVSAAFTTYTDGAGVCTNEYQYTTNGSTWTPYTPGNSITPTNSGTNIIQIQTRRVCNGSACDGPGETWATKAQWSVRPTPTASISGTTAVCQGAASPNITFTNPQTLPVTVTYNINGGANTTVNVAASTTATVAAPTGSAGTFTYNLVSVAYQTAPTCSNAISGSATVTVRPTPTVTISGTTDVCQGAASPNFTISNPQTIPVTVTYNLNGGANTTININGSSSATIGISTASPGTITCNLVSVAYQTAPTCSNAISGSAVITVRPTPTATVSGTTTVCQNGFAPNFTISNPQTLPVTVTYNLNGGANTTININGGSSAYLGVSTSSPGIITCNLVSVAYQSAPTCSNAISGSAVITVRPTPTASISGTTTVCQGVGSPNITFTNPQTIPVTVTYNINGGANTTVNVAASSTATVPQSTATVNTYTYNLVSVAYQSAPTCSNTISGSATVTVQAPPTGTPTLVSNNLCDLSAKLEVTGLTPVTATVTWTKTAGNGSPTSSTDNPLVVNGLTQGTTTTYSASLSTAVCSSVSAGTVTIVVPTRDFNVISTADKCEFCVITDGNVRTIFDANTGNIIARIEDLGTNPAELDETEVCLDVYGSPQQVLTDEGLLQPYLGRRLAVTPTNAASPSVVSWYFTASEYTALLGACAGTPFEFSSPSQLRVTKLEGRLTNPDSDPSDATLIFPSITSYNSDYVATFTVNSFSTFYIHSNRWPFAPLPIELLSFTGYNDGTQNVLEWVTESEVNSSNFDIEKSIDGINWFKIGSVNAAGNSNTQLSYLFNDVNPILGANYYRLKMIDLDGTYEYSSIVKINVSTAISNGFAQVFPNPTPSILNVWVSSTADASLNFEVVDLLGRKIHEFNKQSVIGINKFEFDLSTMAKGSYILKYMDANGVNHTHKFIKE